MFLFLSLYHFLNFYLRYFYSSLRHYFSTYYFLYFFPFLCFYHSSLYFFLFLKEIIFLCILCYFLFLCYMFFFLLFTSAFDVRLKSLSHQNIACIGSSVRLSQICRKCIKQIHLDSILYKTLYNHSFSRCYGYCLPKNHVNESHSRLLAERKSRALILLSLAP